MICVLIICFGFFTPLLTEEITWLECSTKSGLFNVIGTLAVVFAVLAGGFKKNKKAEKKRMFHSRKGRGMKKNTLAGIFFASAGLLLVSGCVSTIESKADGGDIGSMKKMARLYNGERVFVYNPEDELPILGAFTEAVIGKPAKDVNKSFLWMKKAAEKEDISAMFALGQYYGEGFGTSVSFKDSALWFDKALNAASSAKKNPEQVSYDDVCQQIALWFNKNLSSANVAEYHNILLRLGKRINPEAVCFKIANSGLSFEEKIKRMDCFSKDFKRSSDFGPVVNQVIMDHLADVVDASKIKKLFDSRSGVPINLIYCCDYDIAEQIIKEKKQPNKFLKSSLLKKKGLPASASDRGTFFGSRIGNDYYMVDIPDAELANLYEYTRPLTSDERVENFIFGGLQKQTAITPILVFSNDFDENKFYYPEMYLFGVRKRITGVKIEDIINKLKSDYRNLTVKNLSENKVTKIIVGTSYRVSYKPVGYRLEDKDVVLTVKSEKENGLAEPKVEKIKPEDPDYQFALMNAKIHAGFNHSVLKGYSQKAKDKKHREEDKAFEKFFNRNLDVNEMESHLKKYGMIPSLSYNPSDERMKFWHKVMENKKNYRLESPKSQNTDGIVDMAVSSVLVNLLQMQAQLTGKKVDENIVIVECFDKPRYAKAIEQYPKIHKALAKKAALKKQKEYEEKKKEQLNF